MESISMKNKSFFYLLLIFSIFLSNNLWSDELIDKIMSAHNNNDLDEIEKIIREEPEINLQGKNGNKTLMFLLGRSSFFKERKTKNGLNILDITRLFIKKGIDINIKDDYDNTVLIYASPIYENPEIIQLLIDEGAEINTKNIYGITPLMFACNSGNEEVVKVLLNNGAIINSKDNNGDTALIITCFNFTEYQIAKRFGYEDGKFPLIDEDGEEIKRNDEGDVVFFEKKEDGGTRKITYSLKIKNYINIVKLLIKHDADLNIKNNEGDSALSIAKRRNYKEICDILIKSGAK
jgi:ankyrin repeat protein